MILTRSDELNRNCSDEARLPFDLPSTSSDVIPGTEPALDEQTPGSTGASLWDKPAFKETTATIVPSGSGTIAVTSAVAPADAHRFDNCRRGGRRSPERKARESCRAARQLGANMQKLWEAEVEKTGDDNRRKGMIPRNPVQNCSDGTERPNPVATITAWEAAWNITNAIQVPKIII